MENITKQHRKSMEPDDRNSKVVCDDMNQDPSNEDLARYVSHANEVLRSYLKEEDNVSIGYLVY